jgi:hypothetical protein
MGYELSTKKSGISKKWEDQKFLMIGHSGIGKSTFWGFADDVGYIETEAGLNFIDACKNPARDWGDLGQIIGAMGSAVKAGTFPYKLVVLDTIDRVVDFACDATLVWAKEKYKSSDIRGVGDIPNGAGWDMRRQMVNKVLKALEKLPCAVAIVGHLETKKIEEMGSKGYDKNTISIGGKVGGDILSWSDHTLNVVGRMQGDSLKRTVYTKPTQSREAKSRGGIIKDGWVWGDDDKANFDKLRSCFE